MLVGLVDGDGYIAIVDTGRDYIKVELVIALDVRDLSLLNYIRDVESEAAVTGSLNTFFGKTPSYGWG